MTYQGYLNCDKIRKCRTFPHGCSTNCKHYQGMNFTDEPVDMMTHKVLPKFLENRLGSEDERDLVDLFKPF